MKFYMLLPITLALLLSLISCGGGSPAPAADGSALVADGSAPPGLRGLAGPENVHIIKK